MTNKSENLKKNEEKIIALQPERNGLRFVITAMHFGKFQGAKYSKINQWTSGVLTNSLKVASNG